SQACCSRGLAVGDIFHSGQVDVVINNINGRPSLLKNTAPSPLHWLLIRLLGTRTNAAAIGSRVLVDAAGLRQVQEVRSGGSFCSQSDLRLHLGLGAAEQADQIEVRWLGGLRETFNRIPANRLVTIREGNGIISQESY
ncbi:MAG: ASPIC/UnbV domain-containing protein, partial [Terriglobia bacterium]